MRKRKSLKGKRAKQLLVCFDSGNVFNPHNSYTSSKPTTYTAMVDESLYDAPDYKSLDAHSAKCRLWNEWDETGNLKINENPEFKPSEGEFKKYNRELDKMRVILAEAWTQAVSMHEDNLDELVSRHKGVKMDDNGVLQYDSLEAMCTCPTNLNLDHAFIVHLGYRTMRHDSFYALPEDWANLGFHDRAGIMLENNFDQWHLELSHKDDGIDYYSGEPAAEATKKDWEKFYKEWNKSFPWDERQIGDDKDRSKFGKKK
jgi:hypothetical protein